MHFKDCLVRTELVRIKWQAFIFLFTETCLLYISLLKDGVTVSSEDKVSKYKLKSTSNR